MLMLMLRALFNDTISFELNTFRETEYISKYVESFMRSFDSESLFTDKKNSNSINNWESFLTGAARGSLTRKTPG